MNVKQKVPTFAARERRVRNDFRNAARLGQPAPLTPSMTIVRSAEWMDSKFRRDRAERPGGKKPRLSVSS